jgi:hypothetical protein
VNDPDGRTPVGRVNEPDGRPVRVPSVGTAIPAAFRQACTAGLLNSAPNPRPPAAADPVLELDAAALVDEAELDELDELEPPQATRVAVAMARPVPATARRRMDIMFS